MYDEYDLKVMDLLSALAAVVNKAEITTPWAATVPLKEIHAAKRALQWFKDTEMTTDAIKKACGPK